MTLRAAARWSAVGSNGPCPADTAPTQLTRRHAADYARCNRRRGVVFGLRSAATSGQDDRHGAGRSCSMTSSNRHVVIFGRSFERSRTLAAVLFGLALAFIVGGTALDGPVGTILAAVGSTLGTTALVSFLYDPFLKDVLAAEIFEKVGLRDSVVRAGLADIGGADLQLSARLAGSRRIAAAPLDPLAWARERYGEVIAAAKAAATEVVVVLPSPDPSPARTLLADRLDLVEGELERKLSSLPEVLLTAWDAASVAEGSTLTVLWQEQLQSCGLLVCDACAVLETGPVLRQSATDRTVLAQVFEPDSPYGAWASTQLDEMMRDGITAGLRPVTPPAKLPGRHAQVALSSATQDTVGSTPTAAASATASPTSAAEPSVAPDHEESYGRGSRAVDANATKGDDDVA